MNQQDVKRPKPRSLTESEWADICRASRESYFRYVFCTLDFVRGFLALFLAVFLNALFDHGWQIAVAFQAMIRSRVFIMFSTFALFVIIRRSIDWFGKRKTGRVAGL